jgi:hypothetical protein
VYSQPPYYANPNVYNPYGPDPSTFVNPYYQNYYTYNPDPMGVYLRGYRPPVYPTADVFGSWGTGVGPGMGYRSPY